jgi:hypothetical protein
VIVAVPLVQLAVVVAMVNPKVGVGPTESYWYVKGEPARHPAASVIQTPYCPDGNVAGLEVLKIVEGAQRLNHLYV